MKSVDGGTKRYREQSERASMASASNNYML